MDLSQLKPPRGQKHKNQRIGQGMGSGRGKFSGRGAKGAKSISGYSRMRGFEGGQMPLHRRLPKRGFTNIFRKEFAIINLGALDQLEGDSFDPAKLLETGAIRKIKDGLKILGSGELKRKIHVKAHLFSKAALEKIQALGGTVEVLGGNKAPSRAVKPVKERIRKPKSAAPAVETPKAAAPQAEGAEAAEPKKAKKTEKSGEKIAGEKTSKPKQAKPGSKEEK
ncbi:MAG TPA: 50S ribosomal protein L15 [Bryobacteraceae bacterium]|nr:50S ribosomal protein L15 [Bryobacteraceae bacterium]